MEQNKKISTKACKRGHIGLRYAINGNCVQCAILRATGHNIKNKENHNAACREWARANPEKDIEAKKNWKIANSEIVRAQRRKDRKKWRQQNPGKASAQSRERQMVKRLRMPAWADKAAIRHLYEFASALTRNTGRYWHVDHIVPLQGKSVSGLHVPANLRIIPRADNLRKGNTWSEDYATLKIKLEALA